MLEKLKSSLLVLLVVNSAFLTWQIWTYQPQYDYILPTEYVSHEGLADRREMAELIRPDRYIYHFGEDRHTVSYPEMYQYKHIEGRMTDWYFFSLQEINRDEFDLWQQRMLDYVGIELSFSAPIPFFILAETFQIRTDMIELPVINTIWLYQDPITEEVSGLFISEEEQRMIRARTGISPGEIKTYLGLGESRPAYQAYTFNQPGRNVIHLPHYLSTAPVEMTKFLYFYQRIPIHTMIQHLFVDPTIVRQIVDRSGGTFYTDGSRGLQLNQEQTNLYYFYPQTDLVKESSIPQTYIQRSIQFVNQHQGWEETYYLYAIEKNEGNEEIQVQFRRYLGNYPVFSDTIEDEQNVIQVDIQYDRVSGYIRPMILYDQVISQEKVILPAGSKVMEALEKMDLPFQEIKSLSIGYRSGIEEEILTYTPSWVIQLKNGMRIFLPSIPEGIEQEKVEQEQESDSEEVDEEEATTDTEETVDELE